MSFPIFSTGTARGGTTFFARMLSANSQIAMVSDPFLPLFRSYRTAVMRAFIDSNFDESLPLDDYYFSDQSHEKMVAMQNSVLSLPISHKEVLLLREGIAARMNLAAKECIPWISMLNGLDYYELFQSGLKICEKGLGAEAKKWAGFNDNWVIEFFPILARAFPQSKFIAIIRDPRSSVSSALRQKDSKRVPLIYSFIRGWRKHAAFLQYLPSCEELNKNIFILKYEDLVNDPENSNRRLCTFLEVSYEPTMLQTENYRPLAGASWSNYSNFEVPSQGIYTQSVSAWRKHLPPEVIEVIEFVCGPEMELLGYPTEVYGGGALSEAAIRFLYDNYAHCQGWRGHYESLEQELGFEFLRRQFLATSHYQLSEKTINKLFLFPHVLRNLQSLKHSISS